MGDITSEVKSLEKIEGATRVTVEVTAIDMKAVDIMFAAQIRARARAIVAVGPVNTAADTVTDVMAGDIQRLTEIVSRSRMDAGTGRQTIIYEIDVNSE